MTDNEYTEFKRNIANIPEVVSGLVAIEVSGFAKADNRIELCQIWSQIERGCGHGTKALKAFISIADDYQVDITLTVSRLDYDTNDLFYEREENQRLEHLNSRAMSKEELTEWYSSFGFEQDDTSPTGSSKMIRRHRPYIPIFP